MYKALIIAGLLLLAGCVAENTVPYGGYCTHDRECITPTEYLVQSNCAYGSACIENTCRVVCPFTFHDPNPAVSRSYPVVCSQDSDCDCGERGNKTIACVCHRHACLSVEA